MVIDFLCPKCGGTSLEEVVDVVMTYPILMLSYDVRWDQSAEYATGDPTMNHEETTSVRCAGCGFDLGPTLNDAALNIIEKGYRPWS